MDLEILILCVAIFGAAALQAATGIGFGVIAGPALLVVLNDGSAIQISIILNLLIALLLAPSLRHDVDRRLLIQILIGVAVSSPLGLLIYLNIDFESLKVFAGVIVLFTLFYVLRSNRSSLSAVRRAPCKVEQVLIGVVAGVMGSSLAMPGPVPAAWMSAAGYEKKTVRATILFMFVFAYAIALALQFVGPGISAESLWLSLILVPPVIVGILVGVFLHAYIAERTFRWLLMTILMSTVVVLFLSLDSHPI